MTSRKFSPDLPSRNCWAYRGLFRATLLLRAGRATATRSSAHAIRNGGTYAGWAHVFMLDYALPVSALNAEAPEQNLNFHVETVYNDGVDPRPGGGYNDSEFTHVLFTLSTDFDLGNSLVFTPAVNHQITMADDYLRGVCPDHNITWASLTMKYKF